MSTNPGGRSWDPNRNENPPPLPHIVDRGVWSHGRRAHHGRRKNYRGRGGHGGNDRGRGHGRGRQGPPTQQIAGQKRPFEEEDDDPGVNGREPVFNQSGLRQDGRLQPPNDQAPTEQTVLGSISGTTTVRGSLPQEIIKSFIDMAAMSKTNRVTWMVAPEVVMPVEAPSRPLYEPDRMSLAEAQRQSNNKTHGTPSMGVLSSLSRTNSLTWMVTPTEVLMPMASPIRPLWGPDRITKAAFQNPRDNVGFVPPPRAPDQQPRVPFCNHCRTQGHETKECAQVTSEGDTAVDPFCNRVSSTRHHLAFNATALGACAQLAALIAGEDLAQLFQVFVIDRRRKPPLRVRDRELCFVSLTLRYSERFENGQMPPTMEGMWPYTKNDADQHERRLRDFFGEGQGLTGMPAGELESVAFAEIREAYEGGRLPPQFKATRPIRGQPGTS